MRERWQGELIVLCLAAVIFLGSVSAPPHLFDDVDAAFAQIGRVMFQSGDWVTPRLDGVRDMEKPPLLFWLIGLAYRAFGVKDWVARIPLALGAVILCWLTVRFGAWAFGLKGGFYAGLVLVSSLGLYLFTRILFLDGLLTVAITASLYCFVRTLEPDEKRHRQWALGLGAGLGVGLLAKGLIALALPIGAAIAYLILTHQLSLRYLRTRLHPLMTITVMVMIAAPWHILAVTCPPSLVHG
jgi:4-amino-4-deoxy-L-arabinose transferase-like glycosyltransferase